MISPIYNSTLTSSSLHPQTLSSSFFFSFSLYKTFEEKEKIFFVFFCFLNYTRTIMAVEMIEQPSATTNTTVVELSEIAISDTHGEDSPYFAGWKAYDEDPYDEFNNPSGVIQMGLAENQVSFDLLEKFLEKKSEAANVNGNSTISGFRENALFQDYHGLLSFRKVCLYT